MNLLLINESKSLNDSISYPNYNPGPYLFNFYNLFWRVLNSSKFSPIWKQTN